MGNKLALLDYFFSGVAFLGQYVYFHTVFKC